MESGALESESQSIDRAVDLLDHLLEIADGGRGMVVEQYEASTILALLMDKRYRNEAMSQLNDFVYVSEQN